MLSFEELDFLNSWERILKFLVRSVMVKNGFKFKKIKASEGFLKIIFITSKVD